MTGSPVIKFTGAGSRHTAAKLGRMVAEGVSQALAGQTSPLHIDTLRIKLSAGLGTRALNKAISAAIAGKAKRGHK